MTEIEKLHGLHNTGLTMHQRFTLLARQPIGRRGKRHPFPVRTQRQMQNPALIEALFNQLENQVQRFQPVRGIAAYRRGRGGLRRFGSEGSIRSVGFGRKRSNSFGDVNLNKDQRWRRSNGNLSMNGSVYSSRASSVHSQGHWLRRDIAPRRASWGRGRGRGRGGFRGRMNHLNDSVGSRARPARGLGRRGVRRNLAGMRGAVRGVQRGVGRAMQRGVGRGMQQGVGKGMQQGMGRGRGGISRAQTPKPVFTKEELDAQLEEYMSGTKAALDKELDEYMRNAMDFD